MFGYLVNVVYPGCIPAPLAVQGLEPGFWKNQQDCILQQRRQDHLLVFSFWEGAEDEEAVDVLFTDGSMVEDRGGLCCNGRWIDSVSGIWT